MGTSYCLICECELPEGRKLTCSHECYLQLMFHKEEFKRDISKKPDAMDSLHVNISRNKWQRELNIYNQDTEARKWAGLGKRKCEFCGTEFTPKRKDGYYCTPTCQILFDERARGKRVSKPTF